MTIPTDSRSSAEHDTALTAQARGGVSRRKLLKLGVAGSAVAVVSVSSRSVFAATCTKGCTTTPSAFGSINLSRPDVNVCGTGRSPGFWKQEQHFNDWPSGYHPVPSNPPPPGVGSFAATKFSDHFSSVSSPLNTATLLEVLSPELGVVNNAVARSLACALLNAASGRTNGILTIGQVKAIWTEFSTKGYYEPTAGIKWYADSTVPANMTNACGGGIVGYLETTWT